MGKQDNSGNAAAGGERRPANDDSIARLMRLAGPRPSIPEEVRARVHAVVRQEWQKNVVRRRALHWGLPFALAAGVVIAVALNSRGPETGIAPIATVALIDGQGGSPASRWSLGDEIYAGDSVASGEQGIALAIANGLSLRLAAGTTATFDAIDEITVSSGRVYADSGASIDHQRSITIHTRLGSATDTGTQFAVAYLDGKMSIAVREGSVDVSDHRETYTADTGDRLTLQPDSEVAFEKVPVSGPAWNWAVELAPAFDIDNRSLMDFLKWAARETGKELVFENDKVRTAAGLTRLRGSVAGFNPSEAIASVLPTTQFAWSVDERQIAIRALPQ